MNRNSVIIHDMKKIVEFQEKKQLYITDDPKELEILLGQKVPAVALLNEKNRNLPWPHTDYAIENFEQMTTNDLYRIYQRIVGESWEILQTPRLMIREMTVDDVDRFYELYKDPSITEYMENLFENPEDERLYTRNYIKDIYGFYGFGLWTVILKETGEIIGRAGISYRDGFDIPELGFMIGKDYQRKGYAKEAIEAILKYAKQELGFDTIQALVLENNIPSVNLLKKMNFTFSCRRYQDYLIALHTYA